MVDFVTLSCPSCGGKLQIGHEIDRFACSHCGNEHVVKRSGGIVSLEPVIERLTKVQVGVDKTASELALVRLEKEIGPILSEIYWIKDGSLTDPSLKSIRRNIFLGIIGIAVVPIGYYYFAATSQIGNGNSYQNLALIGFAAFLVFLCIVSVISNYARYRQKTSKLRILQDKLEIAEAERRKHERIVKS
jgi:ribosomal protein S27AE